MVKVVNILGGQIVCSLASGKTLRLDNRHTEVIPDSEVTSYIKTLEANGLILLVPVKEVSKTKETTPKKSDNKMKEE